MISPSNRVFYEEYCMRAGGCTSVAMCWHTRNGTPTQWDHRFDSFIHFKYVGFPSL